MIRQDYSAIASWVALGSRVLDLGCGDGTLLALLKRERQASGYGIEIDHASVLGCVANGVNVIQSNLEDGLKGFDSQSFDCVILSQTLQAMRHTELVLDEMLRVGRHAIVTFPNFGYWKPRLQLAWGRMPVSRELPYQWYDTPNVHLFTVHDFEAFCAQKRYIVENRLVLTEGQPRTVLPNLRGALAVYRLSTLSGGQAKS